MTELEKNNKINLENFLKSFITPDMFTEIKLKNMQEKIQAELSLYQQGLEELEQKEHLKRLDYINMLNKINKILITLQNNVQEYEYVNGSYICHNKSVASFLETINSKYNFNLNIQRDYEDESYQLNMPCPIINYHLVDNEVWGDYSLFVKTDDFERQIKYLIENNYTPIFISELENISQINKPIIITFDDGYKNVYEKVWPIIKKYNIKINVFCIVAWLNNDPYLKADMITKMAQSGLVEFQSHGLNHQNLTTLEEKQLINDLKQSQTILREIAHQSVSAYAYPSGQYNAKVLQIISQYYKYAFTTDGEVNDKSNYNLNRMNIYRNNNLEEFKRKLTI